MNPPDSFDSWSATSRLANLSGTHIVIMRLSRVRIRTLLIVVAVVAASIGGIKEYFRLIELSKRYNFIATAVRQNVRMRLAELPGLKANLARLMDSPNRDDVQIELWAIRIDQKQADIASNANFVLIYEHAASHP